MEPNLPSSRLPSFPSRAETPIYRRRRARDAFLSNAFFWGLGNGFVGSTLVVYFLKALPGADSAATLGTAIGWTVAAPRLIGLLRLATPALIDRIGSRKRVCVGFGVLSTLVLALLPVGAPLTAALANAGRINAAFLLIGAIWAFYHLAEYVSTAALWSWLGDVLTPAVRSRFFVRRERRLLLGRLLGLALGGLSAAFPLFPNAPQNRLILPFAGTAFLTVASLILIRAPEIGWTTRRGARACLRRLVAPFRSRPFLSLILFASALQVAQGLTQAPQYQFRTSVLALSLLASNLLLSTTNVGQQLLAPFAGRVARSSVKRACRLALGIVALGFVAYSFATPEAIWLVAVAAVCWVAWVVVNVSLNVELTARADSRERSAFVSAYCAATALAFGLSTTLGGALFDRFRAFEFGVDLPFVGVPLDYSRFIFLVGGALLILASFSLSARDVRETDADDLNDQIDKDLRTKGQR